MWYLSTKTGYLEGRKERSNAKKIKIKMSGGEKIERNEKYGKEKILEEKKKRTGKENKRRTILEGESRR
jgi:hypothetical protein